jgi:peptide/nickel transport system substrate-binding protein
MDEQALRELIRHVATGTLSRRHFVRTLVGLGLTAPMAARLLGAAGLAHAQPRTPAFTPTRRGGGGPLRVIWWQAPTLLNPHFATGTKDQDGSRVFYEPLAGYDPDGNLVPILAAQIPSVENGGLAKDGTWVVWNLKRGVTWHDGRPFTADDVVFNWEYAADPATAAVTVGTYRDLERVEKVDDHTVKIVFKQPTPFWHDAFVGNRGMIIPRHLFGPYAGAKSREAPANLAPVGTGPYRFVDFKPGDLVRGELFAAYHVANRPFFDTIEMKGGGDAVSAARAVIQTGEYDYAWNIQVEDDILRRMEQGGKGRTDIVQGSSIEHIQCNSTDPWKEVDGERASIKTVHPLLSDPAVRAALNLLVDRANIQEQIYGRQGQASANFLNAPSRFYSRNTRWEFNVEKANQVLEGAGWKRGADGIRAKDGKRLKFLLVTSINPLRQKEQAIIKQGAARAGMEMELKTVVASVFFGSDEANPDNIGHFSADLQMYAWQFDVDPLPSLRVFPSWEVASKENKFSGRNTTRWRSEEFDRLYRSAETEMDPVKRAALFIRMNDLVVQNMVVIPLVWRNWVSGVSHKLKATEISGWDSSFWNLAHWYREA